MPYKPFDTGIYFDKLTRSVYSTFTVRILHKVYSHLYLYEKKKNWEILGTVLRGYSAEFSS